MLFSEHPRRILVLGTPGAGKSTLARILGEHLHLPVVHLDAHFWRPGWVKTPEEEWRLTVNELIAGDEWIIDGNYHQSFAERCARADAAVFLDFPRRICYPRIIRRRLAHRGRVRPDMAPGCAEKVDNDFIKWIWNFPKNYRPIIFAAINRYLAGKPVHRLTNPRQVATFLETLDAET